MAGLLRAALSVTHRGDTLPPTVHRGTSRVDGLRLARYARVCGFSLGDEVPPTYPHVLANPLAMDLVNGRDFPYPVVGLIHVGNRIEVRQPIRLGDEVTFAVRATDARPHRRGTVFDIEVTGTVRDRPVWTDRSTYLRRGAPAPRGEPGIGRGVGHPAQDEDGAPPPGTATWRLPADTGRRYAAVSGDRNPIHLYPLTARPFGFARPIAHGMWTMARCLAALEGRLPPAYAVEVAFRAPILLPATVSFGAVADGAGWRFAVRDPSRDRIHLTGVVTSV